jgi:hypothetical protein
MEPGNRSFRALALVFGKLNSGLAKKTEDKALELLNSFSKLDSDFEWLQGEGPPRIDVYQADYCDISHDSFLDYDCVFLAGDLDAQQVFKIRKALQKKEPYEFPFFVFLLPTKEFMPKFIFERETHISAGINSYLDEKLVSMFVHDICAFLMFPNQISADGLQYYGIMGGKRTYLTYEEFNPEDPHLDFQIKPKPESLFAVLFLDPNYDLNKIASILSDALEEHTDDFWFSDVLLTGEKRIMMLHN